MLSQTMQHTQVGGITIFLRLACLLCIRFTFELDTSHKVEMLPVITMKAKDGIKLLFTARN